MKKIPVVARSKPLIRGIPSVLDPSKFPRSTYISLPRAFNREQHYFAIEVLPDNLIDSSEVYAVAGDNEMVLGFLLSSVFPIWVRGVQGNSKKTIDINKCFNTFPFPEFNKKQAKEMSERVSAVLKARGSASGKFLSDIYSSGNIPEHLEMAHEDLDDLVLTIFSLPSNASNDEILEKLFSDYLQHYQS